MHLKKKRKLFVLYSIPINLVNRFNLCKRKYLVSYSLPLSCMVVLLLGLGMMINPGLFSVDKSSAVMIQDGRVVKENDSNLDSSTGHAEGDNNSDSNAAENTDPVDEGFGGFGGDKTELSQEDVDAGISLQAASSAIGITITNTDQVISTVQGGSTAYGNYDVRVTGNLVNDYALSIKAASANLTMPSGASSSTSTISGVGSGTTGTNMGTNKWGYAVTDTSTTNYAGLTYKTTPTVTTNIANGNASSSHTVDITKRLVFAAKFGNDVTPGTYSASITLSATATPADLTGLGIWANGTNAGTTSMQGISSGFCKNNSNVSAGDTIILTDSRDGNQYAVYKASDGNCWMGENLRLSGPTTLTSSNSDVSSNWNMPTDTISWNANIEDDTAYNAIQIKTGSTSLEGWKNGFGNYYSWRAATAGTGTTSVVRTDAPSSICPKGWKLPAYSGDGSLQSLIGSYRSDRLTGQTINGTPNMNGFYFGYDSTSLARGANFWPAAGNIASNGLHNSGESGFYWSRTASNNAKEAFIFRMDSSISFMGFYRYLGYSVRCVASY